MKKRKRNRRASLHFGPIGLIALGLTFSTLAVVFLVHHADPQIPSQESEQSFESAPQENREPSTQGARSKPQTALKAPDALTDERTRNELSLFPFMDEEKIQDLIEIKNDLAKSGFEAEKFDQKLSDLLTKAPNGKVSPEEMIAQLPPGSRAAFKRLLLKILPPQVEPNNNQDQLVPLLSPQDSEKLANSLQLKPNQKIVHYPDGSYAIEK